MHLNKCTGEKLHKTEAAAVSHLFSFSAIQIMRSVFISLSEQSCAGGCWAAADCLAAAAAAAAALLVIGAWLLTAAHSCCP